MTDRQTHPGAQTCPICETPIAPGEGTRQPDGTTIHKVCAEKLREGKEPGA